MLALAALGGCSALVPQTPNAIYDLTAPGDIEPPRGDLQILVPEPTAVQALDTDRIAARPSPAEYAYLPGAVWSDTLPSLVQKRLVETLQNSGRVRAAALPGQGFLINYQLVVDIRAFEFNGDAALVELAVKLMDESSGRVLRSRVFRHAVQVAASDNANVVVALDAAMDAVFLEITDWAFRG
jgi:cholesterol transport system auxiliary component